MSEERLVQLRCGLSVTWQEANPILAVGEMGLELDTGKMKVGDGFTPWNSLPYFGVSDTEFETPPIDPAFTYTNGVLTSIAYGSGQSKTFTYTNGILTSSDFTQDGVVTRKTFNYTLGVLTSITQVIL